MTASISAIILRAGDYALGLAPEGGGAIDFLEWRGEALMRARVGPGPLNSACFPLVPFSNRIAEGRFEARGRSIVLKPNFPGVTHPHPLHGFGWLKPWRVTQVDAASALIEYVHDADEWPWPFACTQSFALTPSGFRHELSLINRSDEAMPSGVGFHPYFPRTAQTRYRGLHRGEWTTSTDGLPLSLSLKDEPVDWWHGAPVSARVVDTVYVGRVGPLEIAWPERGLRLTMRPSPLLSFTTVYAPANGDFFCVEPVSHMTDAVNRSDGRETTGLRWLAPGECLTAEIVYEAAEAP
jgi:aldose 1-epimerase